MDRKEVDSIEFLDWTNLRPYSDWVRDILRASEPLWHQVIAKERVEDPEVFEKEMQAIPFNAPIETKMAVVREAERMGFELAPAFLDKNLKLSPGQDQFWWIINTGALAKGTEKLMDKLHHYLYMELNNPDNVFPSSYSKIVEMRGMMARDFGAFRSLLWTMGQHDIEAGLETNFSFLDKRVPEAVWIYDAYADEVTKHDFFNWAYGWFEFIDVAGV